MAARIRLACAALFLSCAAAHAVMRPPSLEEADTLTLEPWEEKTFRFSRLLGSDLHNAGFYLAVAAVPAAYIAWRHPDRLGFSNGEEGLMIIAYGALPALAATMAAGNMVYARAARLNPHRDLAISHSVLPFLVCTVAAAKVLALAVNADRFTDGKYGGFWVALALTEVVSIPALRLQYRAADRHLDQVRLRVAGGPDRASLVLDF